MTSARQIPAIDVLLRHPLIEARVAAEGHASVVTALRCAARHFRSKLAAGDADDVDPPTWISAEALRLLDVAGVPSLRRVINATGVILHTNLGRAPLAALAAGRAADIAAGYSNLEYDLDAGARGHRHQHAERLLCALTGAEAAVVVNNNAAATWLVLAACAQGREVIVSRGELVEIGGGFRVPDIMAQSGAILREVGTTNRTRISDYASAITERTALILRVHPSNFRMSGFTERPGAGELAALAHQFQMRIFEDLGSGWLGLPHPGGWPDALQDEPSVRDGVSAGLDIIAFSGDKLLGGPQAGIVVGTRDLIDKIRRHPLMRAVRADKQTYAALEATLALWQREPARMEIPVVRMLLEPVKSIEARAKNMNSDLVSPEITSELISGFSTIGGGSAPESSLPTTLIAIRSQAHTASQLDARLRAADVPVIARIHDGALLLDLRTVTPQDDVVVLEQLRTALSSPPA